MCWWGAGADPHLRWPNGTIELPVVWSKGERRWETPDGTYYFDADAADFAAGFFPLFLRHHIGEFDGRPFELLDYQRYVVRALFGWKRQDGLRRFRKVFIAVPKGSGKSPFGSGLGIFLAFFDHEPGAEVYAAASEKGQARIVFDTAKVMVERSEDLSALCDVYRDSIKLKDPHSTEYYQVLSADAPSKHGFRPHGIIFDEFHAQPTRELFDTLYRGMGKRRQPVLVMITTAGDDEESICVAPETRILTEDLHWVQAGSIQVGDVLAGFDEHRRGTNKRCWRKSTVLAARTILRPSYQLVFDDGTEIICSADHMWLVQTAGRRVMWRRTEDLTQTDEFFRVLDVWQEDTSWDAGWLAGMFDGEGHISRNHYGTVNLAFTQRKNEVFAKGKQEIERRGIKVGVYETRAAVDGPKRHPGIYQLRVGRIHNAIRLLGSVRPQRLLAAFREKILDGLCFQAYRHQKLRSKTSVGPRSVVSLTTATGTYVAEGLASHNCFEEWEYARRVISGTIADDTYLPIIFEMAPDDDWTSEAVWRRVNPGYGVTIKADYFKAECAAAQSEPRKRNSFLQLHGNRWVNQATAWIPVEWWDECAADIGDPASLPCAAGLDMAQKIDLVAFVVAFRRQLEGPAPTVELATEDEFGSDRKREVSLNYELLVRPFFWLPEETVRDREKDGFTSFRAWADAGMLSITEGATIDYDQVYRDITEKIIPRFPLLKQGQIGYDPAFATDIANRLRDRAGLTMVEVLQNYQHMNEPAHVFEALVKARRVRHDGHRVLRWNVENVAVKQDDAGRIRPVKPRKSAKKIDGVVALLMALGRLIVMPEAIQQDYRVEWMA